MAQEVKYLSYSGLSYLTDKLEARYERIGHVHDYLPLAGGTMTGTITSQSIIPTTNTTYNLGSTSNQFNIVYTRYIDTVSGYNLRLRAAGVEHLNMISGTVNSTANIIPTTTNTYNLGSSDYIWKNVYATTFIGSLNSKDIRSLTGITSNFSDKTFNPFFSNVTMPTTDWWSGFTSKGWTNDYNSWQLVGISGNVDSSTSDLYWRNGRNDTWNSWKKILDNTNTTYTASVTSSTSGAYQIGTLKIGDTETILYGKNTTYSSLKNPYSLTIQGNGTTLSNGIYDGSAAKTVNITATNVGALPLSGGTLTGALTINGTDSSTANLHFGRTSYNYITGPSGSTIHMCPGGISKSSSTGYIFGSSAFYPGSNNAYSIGTTSLQWNNICGRTLYENGTSLVNKYASKEHLHSTADITGTLPVVNGGTGLTTITAGHVLIGNGTSALTTTEITELTTTEINEIFTDLGVTF